MHLFRLLLWTHWRMFSAWLRHTWKHSPLLLAVLALLIVAYVGLGYVLFRFGIAYLYGFPVVGPLLAQRVVFLIFLFFFVMLVFSNLIIGYTTLFQNRETAWFLSLPISTREIYRWKFFEALVVSSWALIFLSAPLMLAYGSVRQVPWNFYVQVAALYLPFVILPALIGSWAAMAMARLLAGRKLKRLLMIGGSLALVAILVGLRPVTDADVNATNEVVSFDQLLKHTRISLHPALPSAWMARSILAWSDGLLQEGGFYFMMVLSNALMGLVLSSEGVGRLFYGSWSAALAARAARSQRRLEARRLSVQRPSLLERGANIIRRWSPPAAALVVKDARLFWRDPTQWSQFMIFFGLLCIYVANLRNVGAGFTSPFWEALISYLNLAACALTLSTLTTRFVFPQFSLEGRRIWILGLSPFGLQKVLLQKFWLAFGTTTTITTVMMLISSFVLKLPTAKIVCFCLSVVLMSGALSGLSVGLGAIFPNFKEDNPSKIVSGFGGTLCLVISFVYVACFVALAAVPELGRVITGDFVRIPAPLAYGTAFSLSMVALFVPLTLAAARVKRLEI